MKFTSFFVLILAAGSSFGQFHLNSIHNSREISISISCSSDSISVYVGSFIPTDYICNGNVCDIDVKKVKKSSDSLNIIELDFSGSTDPVSNKSQVLFLHKGETLKIRLIRTKGIRIKRKQDLRLSFLIENEVTTAYSKRYSKRFCHYSRTNLPDYIKLDNASN